MNITPEAMKLITSALGTARAIISSRDYIIQMDQAVQVLNFENDQVEWSRCSNELCGTIDALEDMHVCNLSGEILCSDCREEAFDDPYRKPRAS